MNPASEFEASDRGLRDLEIAITGRLASMSRPEAVAAIREGGGRYVELPRPETRLLVLGIDGPPLGKDGRPTRSLEVAAALQRKGHPLAIVDEDAFLNRLDGQHPADASRLYTIAQLARILDIPTGDIRRWIRADLIRPKKVVKRLCYFDFAQVASARRLHQLSQSGVTPNRIRKSLEQIADWLPDQGPNLALTQLEGIERGTLLVRLEDGRLAEPNGQLRLDFDSQSIPDEPAEPCRQLRPREHSAEDWFHIGVQAEENGHFEDAAEAYEQALRIEPQPEIAFNLGNTYYAMGRNVEAASCFIRATELDQEYVEAWNNLGNALAEIGQHDQAIPAYKEALRIEPNYADAHYNLGETLAAMKDHHGAARHWFAYLKQDPNSPWAQRVRNRLSELRGAQQN